MNQIFSRLSTRNWLFHVTLMCFLLGALLAANLNTQWSVKQLGGIPGRMPALAEAYKEQRDRNKDLEGTIKGLRDQLSTYESAQANQSKQAKALSEQLQELKFLVGLTAVRGPGVIVTLDDNKTKRIGDPQSDMYIVHDYDLRNLLNELNAGGAEAIAINEHRITVRTAIRCVGPTVMINGEPTAAPFVLRAIGNIHDLQGALDIPNGIVDVLRVGVKVKVESSEMMEIPAFTGPTNVKYAKPVPPGQEKE